MAPGVVCIPNCRVEMNHGQGNAVNEFLLAMLKMMFAAYLQVKVR